MKEPKCTGLDKRPPADARDWYMASDGAANDEEQRALVPRAETSPDAFHHAPTLMGAVEPAVQGEVRVWAPDRKAAWLPLLGWSGMGLYNLKLQIGLWQIGFINPLFSVMSLVAGVGLPGVFAWYELSRWRKAPYFSTDDAGIGITVWEGAIPLRWTEIVSAHLIAGRLGVSAISAEGVQKFDLDLNRYQKQTRDALLQMIVERANLLHAREVLTGDSVQRLSSFQKWLIRRALPRVDQSRVFARSGEESQRLNALMKESGAAGNVKFHTGPGDRLYRAFYKSVSKRVAAMRRQQEQENPSLPEPGHNSLETPGAPVQLPEAGAPDLDPGSEVPR